MNLGLVILDYLDANNQLSPLSVIPLSGNRCTSKIELTNLT
jgi:hypothetical protein